MCLYINKQYSELSIYLYTYVVHSISVHTFFVWPFKIVVDS